MAVEEELLVEKNEEPTTLHTKASIIAKGNVAIRDKYWED